MIDFGQHTRNIARHRRQHGSELPTDLFGLTPQPGASADLRSAASAARVATRDVFTTHGGLQAQRSSSRSEVSSRQRHAQCGVLHTPLCGVVCTVGAIINLRRVCLLLCARRFGGGWVCSGLPEDMAVITAVCRTIPGEELPARPLCGLCSRSRVSAVLGVPALSHKHDVACASLQQLRTSMSADTAADDFGQRLPLVALRHAARGTLSAERGMEPAQHAADDLQRGDRRQHAVIRREQRLGSPQGGPQELAGLRGGRPSFRARQARKGRWPAARDGICGHSTFPTASSAYSLLFEFSIT